MYNSTKFCDDHLMVNTATHLHSYIKLMLNKQTWRSSEDSSKQSVMVLLMRQLHAVFFCTSLSCLANEYLCRFFLYLLHRTLPQIQNFSVLCEHLSEVLQCKCIFIRKTKQSQNLWNEAVLLLCGTTFSFSERRMKKLEISTHCQTHHQYFG